MEGQKDSFRERKRGVNVSCGAQETEVVMCLCGGA